MRVWEGAGDGTTTGEGVGVGVGAEIVVGDGALRSAGRHPARISEREIRPDE
jgi:hypothetical protein